jgi:hypothetical protein
VTAGDDAIRGSPGVRCTHANLPERIEIAWTVAPAFPM